MAPPKWQGQTRRSIKNRRKTRRIQKGGGRSSGSSRSSVFPGPNQCHPRVGFQKHGGCLPFFVLEGAARHLGITVTGGREAKEVKEAKGAKDQLIHRLGKHLNVDPKNQRSLLNALPIGDQEKEQLAHKWLRPAMPEAWKNDPDMWLDSNNIRDVMKQYEESNPKFKFLGPYPIDFAAKNPYEKGTAAGKDKCLIGEMCSLDLDGPDLSGKEHIGIIYNLDPHYKNGSHWVANYINIPNKTCYYFDSYGMKPPRQVYTFMQWLGIQEPEIQLGWNGRRFQYSDSECGMYSMYFIDRMMAGEPFLKFCRRAPPDRFMLDMRDWMFST